MATSLLYTFRINWVEKLSLSQTQTLTSSAVWLPVNHSLSNTQIFALPVFKSTVLPSTTIHT